MFLFPVVGICCRAEISLDLHETWPCFLSAASRGAHLKVVLFVAAFANRLQPPCLQGESVAAVSASVCYDLLLFIDSFCCCLILSYTKTHLLTSWTASVAFSRTSSHQFLLFFCWGWQTLFYFLVLHDTTVTKILQKQDRFPWRWSFMWARGFIFKTQCSVVWKFWEGKLEVRYELITSRCGMWSESLLFLLMRQESRPHYQHYPQCSWRVFIDVRGSVHFIIQMN